MGLLDAVIIPGESLPQVAAAAASLLGSGETRFVHVQGTDLTIDADPPQRVVLDGEEYGSTPVSARVLPHALKVIVPAA